MTLSELILQASYLGLAGTLFAETGLLVGFMLPGDSLLATVGLLAASGRLSLPAALLALLVGSWLGHQTGYLWGRRLGPGLSQRVNPERLAHSEAFFRRYGPVAVVLAPLIPVVRTLTPFLAGWAYPGRGSPCCRCWARWPGRRASPCWATSPGRPYRGWTSTCCWW